MATLDGSETLSYDVGAVCLGARTAFYGLPGVREHATPLKRLDDAHVIREQFHGLSDGDRVVVGGAGLSGVQVAGELAEMREDSDIEVLLLERKTPSRRRSRRRSSRPSTTRWSTPA